MTRSVKKQGATGEKTALYKPQKAVQEEDLGDLLLCYSYSHNCMALQLGLI